VSTYTVVIELGPTWDAPTHTWTINSGDIPNPVDTSQVLDGLTITGFSLPEQDPYPTQPDPARGNLQLLLDDVSELADISVGDVCNIEISSAGTLVAQWSGRIAQPSASLVRRLNAAGNQVQKVLYSIPLVDFLVDLAELPISGVWPQEPAASRLANIKAAIIAAGGPTVGLTGPPAGGFTLEALTVVEQSALDVINDVFRQVPKDYGRAILYAWADASAGSSYFVSETYFRGVSATTPPGKLTLTAHKLGLTFDETASLPAGLLLDSGRVPESGISFTALKYNTVSTVKVTGSFGTVVLSNGLPGRTVVMSSTLVDADDARAMAAMYLPPADDIGWQMDAFTWLPTDADLAALDFPLFEPTLRRSIIAFPHDRFSRWMQVVIEPISPAINPGSDSSFYGGTLSALTLTIKRGAVSFSGRIARRLLTSAGNTGTVGDVVANFPTVKLKTGTDIVDPTLSVYEAKLARKM
jgi:hypothetical protein